MNKIVVLCLIVLSLGSFAFADCNGAPVTAKGHTAVYVDYQPWYVAQTQGIPSSKPLVSAVTRLGVLYGIADNMDVGLLRIDDSYLFPAATVESLSTEFGYGLTYAYEISKAVKLPVDLRFQFEYDAPRKADIHTKGGKPEDDSSWETGATYLGLTVTKPVLISGLVAAGSLGVFNAWTNNLNDDYAVNEKGSSAFQITAGLDYTVPNTSLTTYATINHIDNSNLVGVEDSTGFIARDNKQDFLCVGLRYDI